MMASHHDLTYWLAIISFKFANILLVNFLFFPVNFSFFPRNLQFLVNLPCFCYESFIFFLAILMLFSKEVLKILPNVSFS